MIQVGSRVRYTVEFLRSAGIYTGPIPFAKGMVTAVKDLGPSIEDNYIGLAVIDWDTPDIPKGVLVTNLEETR